jgi:hypothetical protein
MSKQGKLIMSFHQGGKVTDSKGKKVKATAVQKKAIQATKKKCKAPKPVTVIKHSSSGVPVVSHCRGKRAGRGGAVASEPKRVGETKGALSNATLKALGKAPAKKAPAKKAPAKKAPAKKAPAKKGLTRSQAIKIVFDEQKAKLLKENPKYKFSKLGQSATGMGGKNSFDVEKGDDIFLQTLDTDAVDALTKGGPVPAPAKKAPAKKAPAKRAGETKGGLSKAVLKGIGKEPAKKRIKVKGTRALRAGEKKGALSERVAGSLARAREQKQRSSNPSMGYA